MDGFGRTNDRDRVTIVIEYSVKYKRFRQNLLIDTPQMLAFIARDTTQIWFCRCNLLRTAASWNSTHKHYFFRNIIFSLREKYKMETHKSRLSIITSRITESSRRDTSLIRIHLRCASYNVSSIIRPFKMCFKDARHWFDCRLEPYDTYTRHAKGQASLITKKSDTLFILTRHRFNCRLGSL
jgi:hypothetical protein